MCKKESNKARKGGISRRTASSSGYTGHATGLQCNQGFKPGENAEPNEIFLD